MEQLTLQKEVLEGIIDFTSKEAKQGFKDDAELKKLIDEQKQEYEQIRFRFNLEKYGKIDITPDEIKLRDRIALCGKFATHNFYCREHGFAGCLKSVVQPFFCDSRFCINPDCKCHMFKNNLKRLNDIPELKNEKSLLHWAIGFPLVDLVDFSNDYAKYKKDHEKILNTFTKKVRKLYPQFKGFRTNDFSFTKEADGKVYIHYHLLIKPFKVNKRQFMTDVQKIRMGIIARQRIKIPFHVQSFGFIKKESGFAYLSLRSIGLYKYDKTLNFNYEVPKPGNLKKSIQEGKYMFLKDVMTEEQYLKNVHGKKLFVGFGGIRIPSHGSITTDIMVLKCPICGEISGYHKIRHEIIFNFDQLKPDPPLPLPDSASHNNINEEKSNVEYIKIP
ncbi:hypothetical protein J4429_05005 [Candidatus Pacearchaeota archaeon]|nr:hypothetical protein [Candidatus Pacearchaeota archaeon]